MRTKRHKSLVVGVTGGIGSGKTEVCKMLQALGMKVIYADDLARELMETNAAIGKRLRRVFGEDVYLPEGRLHRRKLAAMVFSDDRYTRKINAIVHPHVLAELKRAIRRETAGNTPVLVIEAALIFESGADRLMDYVIVVDADESRRVARVSLRDGVAAEEVLRRQQKQMPPKEKIARADFVIHNDGDRDMLQSRVGFLHRILNMVAASRVASHGLRES